MLHENLIFSFHFHLDGVIRQISEEWAEMSESVCVNLTFV